MRALLAVTLLMACDVGTRHVASGKLVVGQGAHGWLLFADAAGGLQVSDATVDVFDDAVFRAHGHDPQGRAVSVTFDFRAPPRRSAAGQLTVIAGERTTVVDDARFSPID